MLKPSQLVIKHKPDFIQNKEKGLTLMFNKSKPLNKESPKYNM